MSKRGESVWKRKDGRWEARYIKDRTAEGKAIYGSVYAKTYTEVKRKRQEAVKKLEEREKAPEYEPMAFGAIIKEFLNEHQLTVKHSTLIRYFETAKRHIYPALGVKNINEFDQDDANDFVAGLMSGRPDRLPLSAKSVKDVIGLLKLIYKFAERKKYVQPGRVSFVIPKQQRSVIQVFSPSQRERLEAFACSTEDACRFGVYLCLYTGLRIGEICSLKWSDIDSENSTIKVNRTVMRVKNILSNADKKTRILIDRPKTSSSERVIPVPATLMRMLEELKLNTGAHSGDYFLTGTHKLMEPRNYYERYKRYLKSCDLTGFNFHALRHTFSTRCIEAGIDAKVLSEILGHSSVRITLDLYVHPSLETKRSSLEKLFTV